MGKIKSFIIMFNRITWAKDLAEYMSDTGCEVILIDNNSTYPPLLEWYNTAPYKIHRFKENRLAFDFWYKDVLKDYDCRYYIVTDPDLDISHIPKNYIEILFKGLKSNPDKWKSGFSLEINDLPDNEFTTTIIEWEKMFWNAPTDENGFYRADLATTFALYDRERKVENYYSGVRSPRPYTAKHLPWYLTEEKILNNPEELFYLKNCHSNGWVKHWKI